MHETELEREINFLRLTFQIAPTAAASAPREAASWWLVQEDTFALIARSAIILALGKYPQAVTSPRAVEKMLVENYPIPRRAASRRGAGNFCIHTRGGVKSLESLGVKPSKNTSCHRDPCPRSSLVKGER